MVELWVTVAQDVAKTISTQLALAPQEIAQACFLPVTTMSDELDETGPMLCLSA
jgi:hypothetical protein